MRPAPVGLGITVASPIFAQDTVDPKTAQKIRALTMKYDEAFNRNDAAVVAALFSEDGFYRANGRFSGRHAIERFQGDLVFWVLARQNRVTTADGVASVPSEVLRAEDVVKLFAVTAPV